MALDLSAKTFGEGSKPSSPAPSPSPECDPAFDRMRSSAFSDVHDRRLDPFSPPGFGGRGGVKAVPGPLLPIQAKPERLSPVSPRGGVPPESRPFKGYPLDAMTTMYSQMAASAATISAGLYSPYGGATSPGMHPAAGFMDNVAASPIALYLQQKKRRSDNRKVKVGGQDSGQYSEASLPGDESYLYGDQSPGPLSPAHSPMDDEALAKRQRTSGDQLGADGMSIEERKDESYWERRRKNNEAAKRSRDARRQKEEEIALRAAFLEQENLKLRAQVTILKNETAKLHYMLYNRM